VGCSLKGLQLRCSGQKRAQAPVGLYKRLVLRGGARHPSAHLGIPSLACPS